MKRIGLIVLAAVGGVVVLRPRRFVVVDRSMEPTLVAGQGLIGVRWRPLRIGQLRCVEHPGWPDFWLVKRVTAVDDGFVFVESDNDAVETVDSRRFGAVSAHHSYLVVIRVPTRLM